MQSTIEKLEWQIAELESRVKLLELEIKSLKSTEINIDPVMITTEFKSETEKTLKEALKPGGMLWNAISSR